MEWCMEVGKGQIVGFKRLVLVIYLFGRTLGNSAYIMEVRRVFFDKVSIPTFARSGKLIPVVF